MQIECLLECKFWSTDLCPSFLESLTALLRSSDSKAVGLSYKAKLALWSCHLPSFKQEVHSSKSEDIIRCCYAGPLSQLQLLNLVESVQKLAHKPENSLSERDSEGGNLRNLVLSSNLVKPIISHIMWHGSKIMICHAAASLLGEGSSLALYRGLFSVSTILDNSTRCILARYQ